MTRWLGASEVAARTKSVMKTTLRSGTGRINFLLRAWRPISSHTSPVDSSDIISAVSPKTLQKGGDNGNFKQDFMKLKQPRSSVTTVLQSGNSEAQRTSITKLRRVVKKLCKPKRFERALEVLMLMETQNKIRMSPADHALRLELTIKVHGLLKAEEHFNQLPNIASQKASSLLLLHGYVKEKNTEKAEAFMAKLKGLGLVVDPHLYNEMMKLYVATSQNEKVPLVIKDMKQNHILRNVLSYNLWMNACSELYGFRSVELVYEEMLSDKNVQVGWSTLSTLAKVYTQAGLVHKAFAALKAAEKKLSSGNRLGYFFLITLYATLNDKEGVLRVWTASKAVSDRPTCANYMCILLCLVKLGDLNEAEKIFKEWELDCRNYDIRVSNVLLGAYVRNGLLEKAESLHMHTLERGGTPNYKTWEILMEGCVRSQNLDRGINFLENNFAGLKCHD
ncbi:pentatricopeptide repeat-containing protein At5g27460 isoform X1 [Cucurbita moschata]|uniref:Pentatricopeptide repeat-containing protein At5g27460 isoform X1 n=1 Tax=Cucurbita moschata TaxID=3662 RepID=A0A6J1HF62_CUCMO|nr:pentatricopeptide repeat-containing protein At5g27460 isoform X1 [Cucurbita moschata]